MDKFPDEIWIGDIKFGYCFTSDKPFLNGKGQHYIHESRVPISCGGTMEDSMATGEKYGEESVITQIEPSFGSAESLPATELREGRPPAFIQDDNEGD
jgi:hypothetical protein